MLCIKWDNFCDGVCLVVVLGGGNVVTGSWLVVTALLVMHDARVIVAEPGVSCRCGVH